MEAGPPVGVDVEGDPPDEPEDASLLAVTDAEGLELALVEAPERAAVAPSEMPNAAAVTEPITRLLAIMGFIWSSSTALSPPLPRSHHSTLGPSWQPAVR